ncbi:MAG TPA: hypothetical protein VI756_23355, partial [Blastocatellia bacterium]
KRTDGGVYRLVYKNDSTAVELGLEWREQYLYVELFRLVNGEIRDNPIIIGQKSKLTAFNLEDLVEIRAPHKAIDSESWTTPLTLRSVDHILRRYSELLSKFAADVLVGDFRVFPRLEAKVKSRLQSAAAPRQRAKEAARIQTGAVS